MKNLGTSVSGYLDPSGRAFEQVVMGQNRVILDREFNLMSDLSQEVRTDFVNVSLPSGWFGPNVLTSSNGLGGLFITSSVANELKLATDLIANIQGRTIRVSDTGGAGFNKVSLAAGPSGAGAKRTDLVLLEVWRKLIEPAPSTDGKSVGGRIWRNGNVKIALADDAGLNYIDDLYEVLVAENTTSRVQIQYRLRVVQGVDLYTYPAGIDDPSVTARSTPPNATTPDGNSTVFTYTASTTDNGLWVAGDGNVSNTLQTVDGYMYAIPLMAVFRRNTTAYDQNTNQNGGVASPGPSDRPDGLFHDIIAEQDIVDLRRTISVTGWDYVEMCEKATNSLFDNMTVTEWSQRSAGGGQNGAHILWADEIGFLPGDGTLTGDTPGADFLGEFDAARRSFSDRSTYETLTVRFTPVTTWSTGDVLSINPLSMDIYPYTAVPFASKVPTGTKILDVLSAQFVGSSVSKKSRPVPIGSVAGLGAASISPASLKLGDLTGLGITDEPIWVTVLVSYPTGQGLTRTSLPGTVTFRVNNPSGYLVTAPISYEATTEQVDEPHREVTLKYRTSTLTLTVSADSLGASNVVKMPERVHSVSSVTINATPYVGAVVISDDGRTLTLSTGTTNPGDTVTVQYKGLRPVPNDAVQYTVLYRVRSPQAIRPISLGTSLSLKVRYISSDLWVLTQGSASPDEGYPFPYAYVQTGGINPSSLGSYAGEHELTGNCSVVLSNFSANSGLARLPAHIPCVVNPDELVLNRVSGDVDAEGRTFFKSVPVSTYLLSAYGSPLSSPKRHKNILPMIAELTVDSSIGRKGTLVLVLLTRWAVFDTFNQVFMDPDGTVNTTSASIFRINGNPLNRIS